MRRPRLTPVGALLTVLAVVGAVWGARDTPAASYDAREPAMAAVVRALRDQAVGEPVRIRVTQTDTWLASLVDDDPTVVADVELDAPGDGSRPREVRLWAYGRLTPGGVQLVGDGWHLAGAGVGEADLPLGLVLPAGCSRTGPAEREQGRAVWVLRCDPRDELTRALAAQDWRFCGVGLGTTYHAKGSLLATVASDGNPGSPVRLGQRPRDGVVVPCGP